MGEGREIVGDVGSEEARTGEKAEDVRGWYCDRWGRGVELDSPPASAVAGRLAQRFPSWSLGTRHKISERTSNSGR